MVFYGLGVFSEMYYRETKKIINWKKWGGISNFQQGIEWPFFATTLKKAQSSPLLWRRIENRLSVMHVPKSLLRAPRVQ